MLLGSIFFGIAGILGLILLVQQIMLLVKLFKHGGIGLGILGICIPIFAFIWGWMKAGELGMKKLMTWMTILFILCGLSYGIGAFAFFASPEMQQKFKEAAEQQRLNNGGQPKLNDGGSSLQKEIEKAVRDSQK